MSPALSAVIVAIVAAAGAFFAARTGNRRTHTELQEVHVLVNSQMQRLLVRNDELEQLLQAHGVPIPPAHPHPDVIEEGS